MRYFSLSLSLLALLSLTLGCSNEEGAPFGETGTENPIVEDAGPPPGEPISDASTASDDQIPPELPLVDPDCPSLRLMEFKSAELGPEGGKINLAFTELHLPKGFLNETTKITIARYGMSEKPSQYDYYILLPDGLSSKYRKFDISLSTGYKENNIYPADSVWGYVREDDFWRASTQRDNWAGFFIGFFRMFGKVGIRNVSWERSKICPEDDTKKSSSTPSENSVPPGQSRFGKCFKSKYQLSTEGCDVYGAICHNGLAGNFLCESCIVEQICGVIVEVHCCKTCQVDPDMQNDMTCNAAELALLEDGPDCLIEEYFVSSGCQSVNEGAQRLGGNIAEMEVICPSATTPEIIERQNGSQTCVTVKAGTYSDTPIPILRYPKWTGMPEQCAGAWDLFDCFLRIHEEEHYHIGMSTCENMKIELASIKSTEHCAEDYEQALSAATNEYHALRSAMEQNVARSGQASQDEFDAKTNHGNVTLDCSCEQS